MVRASIEGREARYGERMIEVKVRLWTDNIAPSKGQIIPKHAWTGGVVRVKRNAAHGISPGGPIPFNSFAELPGTIERLLIDEGIKLHATSRERKYLLVE